jgi:hypothetical protein
LCKLHTSKMLCSRKCWNVEVSYCPKVLYTGRLEYSMIIPTIPYPLEHNTVNSHSSLIGPMVYTSPKHTNPKVVFTTLGIYYGILKIWRWCISWYHSHIAWYIPWLSWYIPSFIPWYIPGYITWYIWWYIPCIVSWYFYWYIQPFV